MSRPPTLGARAALLAGCLLVAAGGCEQEASEEPAPAAPYEPRGRLPADAPNVVLIVTDDQDRASLRHMPILRRELGRTGLRFTRAYASAPECGPSRATLLTGQYPHNHGVVANDPPDGGFGALDETQTLPLWLHESGYRTGFIGKYLNGYGWDALGESPEYVPPGWEDWQALTNHTEYQMYGYALNVNGELSQYGEEPRDYQTDVLADRAVAFAGAMPGDERPFFLQVSPLAPHDEGVLEGREVARNPRPAPRHRGALAAAPLPRSEAFNEADVSDKPGFIRRDPRLDAAARAELERLYRSRSESLLAVDELVGRLVGSLRRRGELRDTVFAFTSDNGFLLGEHRQDGKDKLYEESAGVPLILSGPGVGSGRVTHPVSNVDVAPTILELTGVAPGVEQDGTSLLTAGGSPAEPRDVYFELLEDQAFTALRSGDRLYARYADGFEELYAMDADPGQLDNLARRRPEASAGVRRRLSTRTAALADCAGEQCLRLTRSGRP